MLDRRKYLDASEAKLLLDHARGASDREAERNYVVLSLALNAGLRLRELVNLNLSDFKREDGAPVLDVWFSKGRASRRVRVTEPMAELLVYWIEKQRRRLCGESGPMFSVARGESGERRISRRMVQNVFKALARRLGLPEHYTLHSLRHTFATYYYRHTGDLRGLQEALGHASLSTTAIYSHVSAEDHARNMRALPPALSPPGKFRRATGGRTSFAESGYGEERREASAPHR
jgi:integrase/recombinase XerC